MGFLQVAAIARPDLTGDPLVGRLARAQGRPEPAGEHLSQRRDRLGDDRGVIALPRRIDDTERQPGRRQCGPEERPREAGLGLSFAPRTEVVRGHARGEAGLLGLLDIAQKLRGIDLLVRAVESDDGHARGIPVMRRSYVRVNDRRSLRRRRSLH